MKQDQKSNLLKGLKSSRGGQAVVEYILLMVIVVGLIMGAGKVFKGMNEGMQKYVGDYFACLMEYGELPQLGVSENDLKKHISAGKTCDSKFAVFTIEGGRPPTENGGKSGSNNSSSKNGSSDSSGENGSGSGSGKNGNADGKKDGDENSENDSDSDALRGGGRNRARTVKARPGVAAGAYGTVDGPSSGDDGKVRIINDEDSDAAGRERRNRRRARVTSQVRRPEAYRAVSGGMAQAIEKQQVKRIERKPTTTIRSTGEESQGPSRRFASVRPPSLEANSAQDDDKENGFGFSGFMRMMLIIAMIVAIVVFFGGQLLNYSNSD